MPEWLGRKYVGMPGYVWAGLIALIVIGSVAGGLSSGTADSADAGAERACTHFRNVARDAADGILTPDELRNKLAEVERDARASEQAGLSAAARTLLASFTTGTTDPTAAIAAFGDACRAAGL